MHGYPVGMANNLSQKPAEALWSAVGRELARLHVRIRECPDPNGYLEASTHELNLEPKVARLLEARRIGGHTARAMEQLITDLRPHVTKAVTTRFIHGDVHAMNIMCSADGRLLAIIDWGDSGWGDPAVDFAAIPLEMAAHALEAYRAEAPGVLEGVPEAGFLWNRLVDILDDLWETTDRASEVEAMSAFSSRTCGIPAGSGSWTPQDPVDPEGRRM
jgi:aminoglycoside phosphotransferase (APT) family kinase protein